MIIIELSKTDIRNRKFYILLDLLNNESNIILLVDKIKSFLIEYLTKTNYIHMGSNQDIIDTIRRDKLYTVIPLIYNNNKLFHKDIIIDGINLNIDLLYNHNIIIERRWLEETKIDDFLICYLDEVYLKIIRTFKMQ